MSDETTNPAEKPVNQGGGDAPEPEPDQLDAEKPANQGGSD
jgi:hypothetical protein